MAPPSAAALSFVLLTAVATSKVVVTKAVFTHLALPVFYSFLSAIVTALAIAPSFACCTALTLLTPKSQDGVLLSSVAIALDLVLANVALSLLSISLQQCVRAIAPAITLVLEACATRARPGCAVLLPVFGICLGPVIMQARPSAAGNVWGMLAMFGSVVASSAKNVLAHGLIRASKASMSVLSYMFWVELFVALLILPWALLLTDDVASFRGAAPAMQAATLATAAYGGVRIFAQMLFLKYTSPTSLAVSNVVVQLVSTLLGVLFLGEAHDAQTLAGALVTAGSSLLYLRAKRTRARAAPTQESAPDESERARMVSGGNVI